MAAKQFTCNLNPISRFRSTFSTPTTCDEAFAFKRALPAFVANNNLERSAVRDTTAQTAQTDWGASSTDGNHQLHNIFFLKIARELINQDSSGPPNWNKSSLRRF